MKFKVLTPVDKENVTYYVNVEEIAFMSQFVLKQQSLIINPGSPKSHTLVQLRNGQAFAVVETPDEILAEAKVH